MNLSHVVTAVEFVVAEIVEPPDEKALPRRDEIDAGPAPLDPLVESLARPTSEIKIEIDLMDGVRLRVDAFVNERVGWSAMRLRTSLTTRSAKSTPCSPGVGQNSARYVAAPDPNTAAKG